MFHADEPDMPTIMPSSITDLMDCAAKYHSLRVLREWPSRPPHMGAEFGIGFHQVVRQVYDPRNGPLPCLDHLLVWTRAAFFARRYSDHVFRDKEIDRCCWVVCAYTAQDEDAQATIAVEQEGVFPIHHNGEALFRLRARLDRIIVRASDPSTLVVRDYKCARPAVNLYEAYVNLRVAKLLYPAYKHYTLELDWIDADGRVERDLIRGGSLRGIEALVRARALEVFSSADRPKQPGEHCLRCAIQEKCQAQLPVTLEALGEGLEDDAE